MSAHAENRHRCETFLRSKKGDTRYCEITILSQIRRSLTGNIRILLRQPHRERVRVEDCLRHLEVKSMTTVLIRFPYGLNEIWLVL